MAFSDPALRDTRLSVRVLTALGMSCAWVGSICAGLLHAGPAALPQTPSASVQAAERAARSALPIELLGVMVDSADSSRSACLVRCAHPNERRSGSILDVGATACDLGEIREIGLDGVLVRNLLTNQLEMLRFKGNAATPAPPAPADAAAPLVAKASPGRVDVELPKASVDHYLLNLPELLASAQANPRYTNAPNGQRIIGGFEISQIKEGSVVEKLGLKNGDVILAVNGEKLDSLATVLRLVGQSQAAAQATLTVLRGSQRMTFVLNVK